MSCRLHQYPLHVRGGDPVDHAGTAADGAAVEGMLLGNEDTNPVSRILIAIDRPIARSWSFAIEAFVVALAGGALMMRPCLCVPATGVLTSTPPLYEGVFFWSCRRRFAGISIEEARLRDARALHQTIMRFPRGFVRRIGKAGRAEIGHDPREARHDRVRPSRCGLATNRRRRTRYRRGQLTLPLPGSSVPLSATRGWEEGRAHAGA